MFPKARRPKRAQLPGVCFQSAGEFERPLRWSFDFLRFRNKLNASRKARACKREKFRFQLFFFFRPLQLHYTLGILYCWILWTVLLREFSAILWPIEWTCRKPRREVAQLSSIRIKRKFFCVRQADRRRHVHKANTMTFLDRLLLSRKSIKVFQLPKPTIRKPIHDQSPGLIRRRQKKSFVWRRLALCAGLAGDR